MGSEDLRTIIFICIALAIIANDTRANVINNPTTATVYANVEYYLNTNPNVANAKNNAATFHGAVTGQRKQKSLLSRSRIPFWIRADQWRHAKSKVCPHSSQLKTDEQESLSAGTWAVFFLLGDSISLT